MGFSSQTPYFALDIVTDRVAPPFLQGPNGSAWLTAMGQGLDSIRYRSAQAQLLHMPGQGDPSALYYIGLDRLVPQGPAESNSAYATRLQQSVDMWRLRAGSDWGLLTLALGFLSPKQPIAKVVSNTSVWSYYPANGGVTSTPPRRYHAAVNTEANNWNWDGGTWDPHPQGVIAWWRIWELLFADLTIAGTSILAVSNTNPAQVTTTSNHGLSNGNQVYIDEVHGPVNINTGTPLTITVVSPVAFTVPVDTTSKPSYTSGGVVYLAGTNNWVGPSASVGNFTVGPGYTIGLSCPSSWISTLRQMAANMKSEQAWLRNIIVPLDNALFPHDAPSGVTFGNPNGTFGPWVIPTGGVYATGRYDHARYCDGVA